MGKKRQDMKPKQVQPKTDNDQIGENASGYADQNEMYKKTKTGKQ